jgi:hypothetical protein
MIIDRNERRVVSSLGWVEHGGILVIETSDDQAQRVDLGDADYISVYAGEEDRFSALHHYRDGSRVSVSVHSFDDPARSLATLTIDGLAEVGAKAFTGDADEWRRVRSGYVSFYGPALTERDYRIIVIDAARQRATTQPFGWFDKRFDHGYQAPTEAVPVPFEFYGDVDPALSLYAVSVSRDSNLYLYGLENDRLYKEVPIAGQHGGHAPIFRKTAPEAWLTDYDVLVRIDPRTWKVTAKESLQSPFRGVSMFIGEIAFTPDESRCVVPRPGSGDVLTIDPSTFRTVGTAKLGREPLEAVVLSNGKVLARDWKSGDVLSGRLETQ